MDSWSCVRSVLKSVTEYDKLPVSFYGFTLCAFTKSGKLNLIHDLYSSVLHLFELNGKANSLEPLSNLRHFLYARQRAADRSLAAFAPVGKPPSSA